ncbi:MAG TPA: protein kinase [Thermoanaerobaculia bacterium]|nr:protein kinase [Thermoanaerobaculia bacterium]
MTALIGQRLGHYRILDKLGAGGMGEVYLAEDTTLHRRVALKILPPELAASPERLDRFKLEARNLAALDHPNIVTIHSVERAAGVDFLTMAYVEGTTLGELIPEGGLPVESCLKLALSLADGLRAAHEGGIVHRDLKPGNVMVDSTGRLRILDFGLAKLQAPLTSPISSELGTETMSPVMTREGSILGTYPYMSPEQAEGKPTDRRSDLFSFGVVLYEMTTGERPFQGETPVALISSILKDRPRPLVELRLEVPARLREIIERCLEKDPAARFQSADALREALADLQRQVASGEVSRRTQGPPGAKQGLVLSALEASERSPMTRRHYRIAAGAALLAILVIASLAVLTFVRRARAETDRQAVVAEVEDLVDQGRFVDVWRVGGAALERWPHEPQLEHAIRTTSHLVTIATEPPGAAVAFRAYEDISGEWLSLGTTPLKSVRAPLGQLRWRITKEGFEPLEARLEVGAPAAAAGRPDVDAQPIRLRPVGSEPARMVFVPGGRQDGVELTDYWIDQTEVTNQEFKDFIDRGGYEDAQFWTHLARERPQVLGSAGAGGTFRDRTGRPGPSTWELGSYPEGQDEYPVGGVSWYEAVAYCQSKGKRLPTVFHWRKAFGASFFVEVLTAGNFAGRGSEATTRLKEVGPYGTYGMAGNVKEWVWNEFEDQRYILGGAWNEPVYMAIYDDVRPPLHRAEMHGFRCVKESTPSEAIAYAPYGTGLQPARDFTKEKPVRAAEFEIFRGFYSYDRAPLDPRIERIEEAEHWRRERVSFAAAYGGERVLANILLPRNTAPPYQTVIWFPGSYALDLKSSDGDLVFSYYFDFLPRSGRALVYPVYKGTYERQAPSSGMSQWRDLVVQWSKDLGRTIDYLESRSDFNRDKLAYYGFSMGANDALPTLALEPRLKAAILLAGGLSGDVRPPEIDPLNFAPRIEVPVLLLAGRNDFYFPVETSQVPLYNLLGTPAAHKRHVVFEGAGHVPPRIELIREILDWLDRFLGPVEVGVTRGRLRQDE